MLVLSRKQNERLFIGDNIVIKIVRVAGGVVRLGIEARAAVQIQREEVRSRETAASTSSLVHVA